MCRRPMCYRHGSKKGADTFSLLLIGIFLICSGCQKKNNDASSALLSGKAIPDTFLVMEYNVENLFDMVDNGSEYDEFKPNTHNWTRSTYTIKLDNTASVLAAAHPHIAVLLEVENENVVKDLLGVLEKKNCFYRYYVVGVKGKNAKTIPVILSQFPLSPAPDSCSLCSIGEFLEANVFLGIDTLKLFACHWPSKKYPESNRVAAAIALKKRLMQLPRKFDYIIAGDFNENYDECETFHTLGFDNTGGKTGLNHILGTTKRCNGIFAEYVAKNVIDSFSGIVHFDPWLDIAENKRMSEMFHGQNQTPDHILLPPALFDTQGFSYVDRSFQVFTWNGRLLYYGVPYRWQMRFVNKQKYHRGEGYSDHLPIMVKLCRRAFSIDPHSPSSPTLSSRNIHSGTIGFETGYEGWVKGESPHIHVSRDTVHAQTGTFCLKIAGTVGKQNGCVARAVIKNSCTAPKYCTLYLRGSGDMCLRIRPDGVKRWTYYYGPHYTVARVGKYAMATFTTWTLLRLPLESVQGGVKEFNVEIRGKKEHSITVWLDNVQIQCGA